MSEYLVKLYTLVPYPFLDCCVFSFVTLYFLFLFWNRCSVNSTVSPYGLQLVHNFYIILAAGTLLVTGWIFFILPEYFFGGVIILIQLVCVLAYLLYLRYTCFFSYVVVAMEIPRVPLLCALLISFSGVFYSALSFLVIANVLSDFSLAHLLAQEIHQHFPLEQTTQNSTGGLGEGVSLLPAYYGVIVPLASLVPPAPVPPVR